MMAAAAAARTVQLTVYLSDGIRSAHEPCVSVLVDECASAHDVVRAAATKARLVSPHGFELAEVFVSHGQPRKARHLEPTQLPHRIQSLWPQAAPASSLPEALVAEYRFYLVRKDVPTSGPAIATAVSAAAVTTSSVHEAGDPTMAATVAAAGGMVAGGMAVAAGSGGPAAAAAALQTGPGMLRTLTWSECSNAGVPPDPFLVAFLSQRWEGVDCADLCRLPSLDERSMLQNLRQRFGDRNAYTYVGSILVAVNPFQFFPVYNPKYVRMYEGRRLGELPPHIFAVADAAFHTMIETRQSQCVVISGESGSGKTESTNFLLHHLTHLSHKGVVSNGAGVERTLLGAGPVLEAFGNAKTVHNNNSSRFGKFIQVNYRKNGTVYGAVVEKYLLEKSRIVSQPREERNYHVFYYLLGGAPTDVQQGLSLGQPSDYNYLNQSGCYEVSDVDNHVEYARLLQSMELVGFTADIQKKILSILATVLHLGNIDFQKKHDHHHDEAVLISNTDVLTVISGLLCVKEDTLLEALTSRRTVAGGETVVVNYKRHDAVAQRDAMAKCLYGALFDWIVLQINNALLLKQDSHELLGNSIGVLDIFGFEDFRINGFEQFCINYANEHLQYYFNQHIFKFEQEEYQKEGIVWKNIEFIDNTGCIDLFAKRPKGLFFLLDEEGNFPGATNDTLLEKFNQNHRSNLYYQMPTKKESAFIICHYAGKVKYHVQDFREKNNDHMRPDIVSVLKNSSLSFVKELVGSSPIAMLRWAYLRICIKSLWAFIDAGRRFYRAGGAKIGVRRRQSVQKVGQKPLQSSRDSDVPDAGDDVIDGAPSSCDNADRPVFQDESDSAADSFIYKGSSDTKPRRKSSRGKHRLKARLYKGNKDLQTLQDARETTKSKTPTISLQFQQSLGLLLRELDKANPYFVRCIKSNESQAPNFFDDDVVLRQLRYTGMLATIKIRHSGYNCRTLFEDFTRQYAALLPKGASSDKDDIRKFLSDIDCKGNFQIGMTKVFLRETLKILLDQALDHALTARIVKIQRWVRARLRRLHYVRMQTAAQAIQKCWRHWVRHAHAHAAELHQQEAAHAGGSSREASEQPAAAATADATPKEEEEGQEKEDQRHSRALADHDSPLPMLTGFRSINRSTFSSAGRLSRDDSQFERDFESLIDQGVDTLNRVNSFSSSSDADDDHHDEPRPPSPRLQQLSLRPRSLSPCPRSPSPRPQLPEQRPQDLSVRPLPPSPRPTPPPRPPPWEPSRQPEPPAEATPAVSAAAQGDVPAAGAVATATATPTPATSGEPSCTRVPPPGAILVTTPSSRQLLPFEADGAESAVPAEQGAGARFGEPAHFSKELRAQRSEDSPAPLEEPAAGGSKRDRRASIDSSGSSTSGGSTSGSSSLSESINSKADADTSVAAETHAISNRIQRPSNLSGSAHASPRVPRALVPQDEHARHGTLEGLEFDRFSVYRKGIKKSHSADSIPVAQALPAPVQPTAATPEPGAGLTTERSPLSAKSSLPTAHRSEESLERGAGAASAAAAAETGARKPDVAAEDSKSLLSVKSTVDDWAHQQRPRSPSSSSSSKGAHIFNRLKNKLSGTRSVRNVPDDLELVDLKSPSGATTAARLPTEPGLHVDVSARGPADVPPPSSAAVPQLGRSRSNRVKNSAAKEPPAPATTPVAAAAAGTQQWNVSGTSQWQYPENWEIRSHGTLYKMYELIHHKKMDFNKGFSKTQEVPVFERVFRDALTEFERLLFIRAASGKSADEMFAPIKYRDLMDRFSQMLTKAIRCNVQPSSVCEFPSIIVINAFRGYLDEFHKQTGNEEKRVKKPKKKKEKTKGNQAVVACGHRLYSMTISIKTFCEVCNKLITFFDKGLECEACKFTCHKICTSKCTGVCSFSLQEAENAGSGFVFGRRLSQLISDEDHPVPLLFEKLLQAVETKGLFTEGVYRKSGLAERVKNLKKAIDTTANPENIDFHEYAVHVLTSAVKSILRDLSEPLLTYVLYNEFVRAADVEDDSEALRALKASIEKLPACNHAVLMRLLVHLATVAQNEPTNRMSANALAIVFSPCLLKTPSSGNTLGRSGGGGSKRSSLTGSQAVQEGLRDVPRQVRCVELLIDWMLRRLNSTFDDLEALDRDEQQATARLTKVRASMRSTRRKGSHPLPLPLSKTTLDGSDVSLTSAPAEAVHSDGATSTAASQTAFDLSSPLTPSDDIDPEVAAVLLRRYTKDLEDVRLKRSRVAGRLAKLGTMTDDDQASTDDIDTSGDSIDDISLEENCGGSRAAASAAGQSASAVSTPAVSLPSVPEIAE